MVLSDDLARTVLATQQLPLPDEREESLIREIGEALLLTPEKQYIVVEQAKNEAIPIDIDGWESVVLEQRDGTRVRLKIRDTPAIGGYLVLLKRKLK